MHETLTLVLAAMAGLALGAFFFGGLWWTVNRGLTSPRPAVWFLGSFLVRMGVTLAGFYFVSDGHWQRLLLALIGFFTARVTVMWLTRPSKNHQTHPEREVSHATESR
ncbi:ATP synthase subunit I [soil metagenome]